MRTLLQKVGGALRRHRGDPPTVVARKMIGSAVALARGFVHLRGCDRVGPRARCFGRPHVLNDGSVSIGADFALSCAFGTVQIAAGEDGVVEVGDDVSINYGTAVSARTLVRIGDRVKIGPYCVISDAELPLPLAIAGDDEPRAIEIGSDVWLGARVTVLPGARIGHGAVVSAGSVVAGEIPSGAIAAGVPAKVLRIGSVPPAPPREPARVTSIAAERVEERAADAVVH